MKPAAKSASKSTSRAPRKASAKPVRRGGTPGENGGLTPNEKTNLLLEAKDAFNYQSALGRIEPGTTFDDWRRDMVMDRVGKPGISKIHRGHWADVKIMFLELAGKDDEALALRLRSGVKTYRPVDGNDTWESCDQYVFWIREALEAHRTAVLAPNHRRIYPGWILTAARQRNSKGNLTMDNLAERLDPKTLCGLLSHLKNHIAVREGRDMPELRAERVYPKKANQGEMYDPF